MDKSEKGVVFYTDNQIGEPIKSKVQESILASGLPIVSCSLEPMDFGENVVVVGERGYVSYMKQIITALGVSRADIVFFCEHDCLYPKSHFGFTPARSDIFYYNANNWRWLFGSKAAITYDRLISLSGLCVNRQFALDHYWKRLREMQRIGLDQFTKPEPRIARKWGYEPGTKKRRRGGFSDDNFETWFSAEPIIDIRHDGTVSKAKVTLDSFKHQPKNWQEISIDDVPGWKLRTLFGL